MVLNDFCEAIVDCEHKTAPAQDTGYPSIRTPNIGRGYFILDNVNRVSEETYRLWTRRATPRAGDLIMAREAPVGNVAMIPDGLTPCLGQRTVLIQCNKKKVFPRYLSYLLVGPQVQAVIHSMTNGVTVPHLNVEDIRTLPLPELPPLPTQRKIAAILAAYDDLIENNTRRIKILEDMAQAIYREWFVHFRFPGHEGVKLVDSGTELGKVPEGWEVKKLSEVADVIDCLHSKKPYQVENGNRILLQLFNIGEKGKLDLTKLYLISEDDYKLWTSRIEAQEGDCVITNVGRIAAVAQIPKGVCVALGRNMTGVRPKKIPPTYLIEYLLSSHMENEVWKKKDSGTIMDSLNVRGIIRLSIQIPPSTILENFDLLIEPIRERINILIKQNSNLRETRDLLLPRLISGELEVSELEIATA